jgi:hypothetical protein
MPTNDVLTHLGARVVKRLQSLRSDPLLSGLLGGSHSASPKTGYGLTNDFSRLINVLGAFPTIVGYFKGRRLSSSLVSVESEADVQDLLFTMLKPMFPTLVYEEPTQKGAVGYSIGDFALPEMALIVEAKFVANRDRVKAVADEIAEDIWKYSNQTTCERIVFFVYDPHVLIPDREAFVRSNSPSDFAVRGRSIQVIVVIKP